MITNAYAVKVCAEHGISTWIREGAVYSYGATRHEEERVPVSSLADLLAWLGY